MKFRYLLWGVKYFSCQNILGNIEKNWRTFFLFINFFGIPYVITFFQKIPIFPMYLKFHTSHMWAPPFLEPKKLRKNRKILVRCKFLKIKILYAYKSVTAIQRWIMSTHNPLEAWKTIITVWKLALKMGSHMWSFWHTFCE